MRIASVNSYPNVYSAQNTNNYQNIPNKDTVAFGMKMGNSWKQYIEYVEGSFSNIIAKMCGRETPAQRLRALIAKMEAHPDSLVCDIAPSEGGFSNESGTGIIYRSPIVGIYKEGSLKSSVSFDTDSFWDARELEEHSYYKTFCGLTVGRVISKLEKFFEDPDKLVRAAEKFLAKQANT